MGAGGRFLARRAVFPKTGKPGGSSLPGTSSGGNANTFVSALGNIEGNIDRGSILRELRSQGTLNTTSYLISIGNTSHLRSILSPVAATFSYFTWRNGEFLSSPPLSREPGGETGGVIQRIETHTMTIDDDYP